MNAKINQAILILDYLTIIRLIIRLNDFSIERFDDLIDYAFQKEGFRRHRLTSLGTLFALNNLTEL